MEECHYSLQLGLHVWLFKLGLAFIPIDTCTLGTGAWQARPV